MSTVNIKRAVDNHCGDTTIYTPIIESIVNSIQSIQMRGCLDGEINVKFIRSKQERLLGNMAKPDIVSVEVHDNGIGFNNSNKTSFDTLYSDYKLLYGGKGFGRLTFLKYYNNVRVKSRFEEDGTFYNYSFDFLGNDNKFITGEVKNPIDSNSYLTTIYLSNLKSEHTDKFDKNLDTIARKIFEHLLIYFINDNFVCPKITLEDEYSNETIVLNEYLSKHKEISQVDGRTIEIGDELDKKTFNVKIFKIYYSNKVSSINLVADNRLVEYTSLHQYIPEFKEGLFEKEVKDKGEVVERNFSIKAYVMGDYLDNNVSIERSRFNFSKKKDPLWPVSQEEIESTVSNLIKEKYLDEYTSRFNKKTDRITNYVNTEASWHKPYIEDLDLTKIHYDATDEEIEIELQKIKFEKEINAKKEITQIINKIDTNEDIPDKLEELIGTLTESGRSDLIHYVSSRKVILELFGKSLESDNSGKYQLEKAIHNIICPMNIDSNSIEFENHNLWIIDERLTFNNFLSSDKPLNVKDERPDLLIFDNAVSIRGENDPSTPIIIFEFKKPQRENYSGNEKDPIEQIGTYVKKIKSGDYKKKGRDIKITENTPFYGFLICDLTDKIREFCEERYSLIPSPDMEGYFGFLKGYGFYLEVKSFDKLLKDANQRNKIFFKKLGIE